MEREGLFRSIKFMQQEGLEIEMLVTDRHVQIAKWMRENQPRIRHRYDVWHVAKSKLTANVGTKRLFVQNNQSSYSLSWHRCTQEVTGSGKTERMSVSY